MLTTTDETRWARRSRWPESQTDAGSIEDVLDILGRTVVYLSCVKSSWEVLSTITPRGSFAIRRSIEALNVSRYQSDGEINQCPVSADLRIAGRIHHRAQAHTLVTLVSTRGNRTRCK